MIETEDPRRRARRAALILSLAALAGAAILLVGSGFSAIVASVEIRVHEPWPLLGLGAVAAAAAFRMGGAARVRADLDAAWEMRESWAAGMACSAAMVAVLVGLGLGTWTAGSADAYGYVSQSQLWRTGTLTQPEPLASKVPWPQPEWSLSPLGFRPATTPGSIVPTYPPGLPLAMAAVSSVAGFRAVFWIVPLLGGAAVWMTYQAGRQFADAFSASIGALLLALSPVFLYQVVQPMSDVPVTAWWMSALAGMLSGHPLVSGLCAAAALLTRPNLAALAVWLLFGLAWRERAAGRPWRAVTSAALLYGSPVAAAAGSLAVLNTHLYGHPMASGYGSASALFSIANLSTNLRHFVTWLWMTQTPLLFAGLLAPALMRRSLFALGFAALVLGSYLAYASFEEWWYLRFLLPALPILLVTAAVVVLRPLTYVPQAVRVPMTVVGLALLAGHYLVIAEQGGVTALRTLEQRYVAAGTYVAEATPRTAVFFGVQESGPLRLYGQRTTIRFDYIEPDGLDAAVAFLQRAGYQPYFAVEDWEEAQFRARFAAANALGSLDWPPAAEIGSAVKVRLYDPRDRARYLAGATVRTVRVRAAGNTGAR